MSEFFGIVRWCDEDIENALEVQGFEPTQENIDVIRNLLNHHSFTDMMIETGWEYIYNTINNHEIELN